MGLLNLTLNPPFHSHLTLAGGNGICDDLWGQRALFQRNDHGLEMAGGAGGRPSVVRSRGRFADFDLAPDLGSRIGTLTWYRGAATCVGLCALTFLLSPGFENPIYGYVPPALQGKELDAARAQAIKPLDQGSGTGYHVAATKLVAPLSDTPERPQLTLPLSIGSGDALASLLKRSGVGETDSTQVMALLHKAVALDDVGSTHGELILGRRADKSQPRPLEQLAFRARFDLNLQVSRANGVLTLKEMPIAIDNTPLRIQGEFGSSLYRSARAAGAPAKAVETYIRSLGTRMPVSHIGSGCKFDIIVEQKRAETGEVQMGNLLYAGVAGCSNKMQLVRTAVDGHDEWYDGSGRGERKGSMGMPVNGRISSGFGMRRHPILGYVRMHKGIDIAAHYGSPVYAATDGVVQFAGRSSGYGNFVKLAHGDGFGTGYGHLSRILVRPGQHVRRGQQIAASGNSGLSTGPHLHYETYRNGVAVNPMSFSFSVVQQLTGGDLSSFRARLAKLLSVPVGHGVKEDEESDDE
jgi:murein DD-endopeptidase MepM/ murein hydrolase activator NlpD